MKTQKAVIDSMMESTRIRLRNQEDAFVDTLSSAYKAASDEIVGKVVTVYRELRPDGWAFAPARKSGYLDRLLRNINGTISQLNQKAIRGTGDAMLAQYDLSSASTAWMIDQATPPNVLPAYPDLALPSVQAMVATPMTGAMFSQQIGMVSDKMAFDINQGLTQSLIQGESMDDAASRVEGIIGGDSDGLAYRAMTIARTEIMRAQNIGRDFIYDANSDLMAGEPIWVITPDEALCPWCLRCDGKTPSQIAALASKKDPTAGVNRPPKHPNCRCTTKPQLKTWKSLIGTDMPEDFGPAERGMRNATTGKWEYAPLKQFEDWQADALRRASPIIGDM